MVLYLKASYDIKIVYYIFIAYCPLWKYLCFHLLSIFGAQHKWVIRNECINIQCVTKSSWFNTESTQVIFLVQQHRDNSFVAWLSCNYHLGIQTHFHQVTSFALCMFSMNTLQFSRETGNWPFFSKCKNMFCICINQQPQRKPADALAAIRKLALASDKLAKRWSVQ